MNRFYEKVYTLFGRDFGDVVLREVKDEMNGGDIVYSVLVVPSMVLSFHNKDKSLIFELFETKIGYYNSEDDFIPLSPSFRHIDNYTKTYHLLKFISHLWECKSDIEHIHKLRELLGIDKISGAKL